MSKSIEFASEAPESYSSLRLVIGVLLAYILVASFGIWTAAAFEHDGLQLALPYNALSEHDVGGD